MGTGRKMYLGTENGVVTLAEEDQGWRVAGASLPGKAIGDLKTLPSGEVLCSISGHGVYASNDGGATWDRSLAGDVRALAADPNDPWTLYAGTEPVALFCSRDGGDSWTEIEGLQRMPDDVQEKWWFPQPPHEGHVLSIYVDPDDSRDITLGIEHGGIVRTRDGGATWEDLSAGVEYLDIHMVTRDPAQAELFYAATARGFYRSAQGGRDWVLATAGISRDYFHHFVVRPGPASSLFLATAHGSPPSWLREGRAKAAIYRSEDAGRSWQQLTGGLPASLERAVNSLVGDPSEETRLYAALGDYGPTLPKGQVPGGEVWATSDRGTTWERIYDAASPVRSLCVSV